MTSLQRNKSPFSPINPFIRNIHPFSSHGVAKFTMLIDVLVIFLTYSRLSIVCSKHKNIYLCLN